MKRLTITLENATDEEIGAVARIINDYNCTAMQSDWQPLTLLLRDSHGRVVGGLHGKTEWGWLFVETLAIEEPYRNQGHGSRLLALAEEEARARGCHDAFLDTFSFQARPFYEARGYRLFGALEDFAGHTKFFLRKALRGDPAQAPDGRGT